MASSNDQIGREQSRRPEINTPKRGGGVGLIEEIPDKGSDQAEKSSFGSEVTQTLRSTEAAVLGLGLSPVEIQSWQVARELVENIKPVPWFIWRVSNLVFNSIDTETRIPEGMVFGLRRLLFACASDPALGCGEKINSVKRALAVVDPGVIAAVAVLHAVSRKIATYPHERIWRPILEDALLRSRLGLLIGQRCTSFGGGRGILAGFAGRVGLTVLIASGSIEQAHMALEQLATGQELKSVGINIYRCDPVQVSAMILSASGCGRDAAFGTVAYAASAGSDWSGFDQQQLQWLAAFTLIDRARSNTLDEVPQEFFELFNIDGAADLELLHGEVKKIIRQGHGWNWIL